MDTARRPSAHNTFSCKKKSGASGMSRIQVSFKVVQPNFFTTKARERERERVAETGMAKKRLQQRRGGRDITDIPRRETRDKRQTQRQRTVKRRRRKTRDKGTQRHGDGSAYRLEGARLEHHVVAPGVERAAEQDVVSNLWMIVKKKRGRTRAKTISSARVVGD